MQAIGIVKGKFRFDVEASGQTYVLAARSEKDRQLWLSALEQALARSGSSNVQGQAAQPLATLADSVALAAAAGIRTSLSAFVSCGMPAESTPDWLDGA